MILHGTFDNLTLIPKPPFFRAISEPAKVEDRLKMLRQMHTAVTPGAEVSSQVDDTVSS